MQFTDVRRVGFDTETTGTDPDEARIVTAALVARGGGFPDKTLTWLINPGVPIPDEAAAVHSITTEIAQAKGLDPKVALEEIALRLTIALEHGMPVIAFNMAYDWTVLDRDLRRHNLRTMEERIGGRPVGLVDSLVIDRRVDRYRKGHRKLGDVARHYGVVLTDWHSADADALAALGIAGKLFERYVTVSQLSPEELFDAQVAWHAEWAAGFEAHLRSTTDPDAVIDGSWPLRPLPVAVAS